MVCFGSGAEVSEEEKVRRWALSLGGRAILVVYFVCEVEN